MHIDTMLILQAYLPVDLGLEINWNYWNIFGFLKCYDSLPV